MMIVVRRFFVKELIKNAAAFCKPSRNSSIYNFLYDIQFTHQGVLENAGEIDFALTR